MLPYPFSLVRLTLPLSFLLLFYQLPAALAQLQVQLHFYTDNECQNASTEQAALSISISKCIVTIGLGSISHSTVPCSNGNVQLLAFSDTACGTQLNLYRQGTGNTCFGPYSGDIAAVMLTCAQEDDTGKINPGTPTTTSTISVGPVADAAPTATKSVSGSSGSVTVTQTAASGSPSSSGGASANDNGTGGASTNGNSTGGANPSSSSSSSGLSTSDIISLAVGLGVGIPTVILSYLGVRWARIRYNMRHGNSHENAYSLGLISTGEVYR